MQHPKLFYKTPGIKWLDALPLGNGRIAAMVYGQVRNELIQLDESTFWSGEASTDNVPEGSAEIVQAMRRSLFEADYKRANVLGSQMTGKKLNYGTHLPLGNLKLDFDNVGDDPPAHADYTRTLDLRTGIASVSYRVGDTDYVREIFISNPHQVFVAKFVSTQTSAVNLTVSFQTLGHPISAQVDEAGDLVIEASAFEPIAVGCPSRVDMS